MIRLIYYTENLLQISRRKKHVNLTIMRSLCLVVSQYLSGNCWVRDSPRTPSTTPLLPNMAAAGELIHPQGTVDLESTRYLSNHHWSPLRKGWPSFFLGSILISCCCCNKLLETHWLQTTQLYYCTVQEGRSPKVKVFGKALFLLEENLFPFPFQLLEATHNSVAQDHITLTSASIITTPPGLLPTSGPSLRKTVVIMLGSPG